MSFLNYQRRIAFTVGKLRDRTLPGVRGGGLFNLSNDAALNNTRTSTRCQHDHLAISDVHNVSQLDDLR